MLSESKSSKAVCVVIQASFPNYLYHACIQTLVSLFSQVFKNMKTHYYYWIGRMPSKTKID